MEFTSHQIHQTPRIIVVVESVHHGNTMQVANILGSVLEADVVSADSVSPSELSKYDCVAFGSGIYFGRHHRAVRALVASLDHVSQKAIVFSTAGLPFLSAAFHWPVRQTLRKCGREVIGEFCCRGWDTVGPLFLMGGINRKHPNERDLNRARAFAERMRAVVDGFDASPPKKLHQNASNSLIPPQQTTEDFRSSQRAQR